MSAMKSNSMIQNKRIPGKNRTMGFLSIDLAADEKNTTGMAVLEKGTTTFSVHSDREILEAAEKYRPELVGIDAPLSLPYGRKDISERNGRHFRECDLELRKLGIRFFPITIGGMRRLTRRGMKLKEMLEGRGYRVVEIFPGASFDLLGIERKHVVKANEFLGCKASNVHESDAAIGAYTLFLYSKGKAEFLSGKDGEILVPSPA
ncbi:DUF429 domain-containing protein [Candidatus Micrarchaeota archaeon]|nr:DUF429 domain-containing protein [Candidatus Micrarchaeota archaeon]